MKEYRYLFKDKTRLVFEGAGILEIPEATALECFEHAINIGNNPNIITNFIEHSVEEYGEGLFDISKANIEELYKQIRDARFIQFFSDEEKTEEGKESPFYSILDAISERIGDPYDFLEKRTWRQVSQLLKGKIWNSRAGVKHYDPKNPKKVTYDGDAENRKMLLKEKGKDMPQVDHFDYIDQLIQKQK